MLVCPSCGQENPQIAKFCLSCGAALTAAGARGGRGTEGRHPLFTEIVGSRASAEQIDPDVRARLAPYYARVPRQLRRFGGTVEKFIADPGVLWQSSRGFLTWALGQRLLA